MSALNEKVLVLNKSFLPVNIHDVANAISLVYQRVAMIIDEDMRGYDFEGWRELKPSEEEIQKGYTIGLVANEKIRIPKVIRLCEYNRIPRRGVKFSRQNVLYRDRWVCQYCGKEYRLHSGMLNMDHVIPRSRGGVTTWENIVTSCVDCNHKKDNKTPQEAGMKLVKRPQKPQWTYVALASRVRSIPESWKPFLVSY